MAGLTIRVRTKGLEELQGALKRAGAKAKPIAMKALYDVGKKIQWRARHRLEGGVFSYSTGFLRESIGIRFRDNGVEVGSFAPHATPFEGPEPSFWRKRPPLAPFVLWAKRALKASEEEATSIYFGWVKKKMPHMITPHPYLKPALEESETEIEERLFQAVKEILK